MLRQSITNEVSSLMTILLREVTKQLAQYLHNLLPETNDDWWQSAVVGVLTHTQQSRMKQQGISTLEALDLAALLRVLDQNWYQISTRRNLPRESRHYIKEMQTIRNHWAHVSAEGRSVENTYRDLDTLQRLAEMIESEAFVIEKIQDTKESLIQPTPSQSDPPPEPQNDTEFSVGQIVGERSNSGKRGAVVSVHILPPENRYDVFLDGQVKTYYASQLVAEDSQETTYQFMPCDQFHSYLTALQIQYPGLSTLYSLNAARVDFIPYQFRPVLKFIRSDRPRLLIADGVGVGKTIEAGLILRELQARRDIRSILIVCPRPLVTERKWQTEMKRFDENFVHLDGPLLRHCINEMDLEGEWPEQYERVIVPYSLFDERLLYGTEAENRRRRRTGLLQLDPPPRFDLVIVDEAHHIRNQDTFSHQAVRFFCDHAEAAIFLTATPIQLGTQDLFVLLNTLRPDLIIDEQSFEHMAEPNPFINDAIGAFRSQESDWMEKATDALVSAGNTAWGQTMLKKNPKYEQICSGLTDGNITTEQRVHHITELEELHTFSRIINRTRRRDIGAFTIRKPDTIEVEFTPPQKQLHDSLLQVQAEIFTRLHGNQNVKFMMTTIRRQAASCLFGLAPFLEDILNRHIDELTWVETDDTGPIIENGAVESIESEIEKIIELAHSLPPDDPKLEALCQILTDKQEMPNKRVMLFSSFRHTLSYLYRNLSNRGFRVGMVHGGTPEEERVLLREQFEGNEDTVNSINVLLFSEIGCEGLDYQFCDCIVNYDLPWNPMRIEQRIGRIDRKGQQSETVAIYNLITPGTVDADIYNRCLLRIGVFNNALGASEEILGDITREIRDIAESFTLTDEERQKKLQQLSDNKIRLVKEQEELEQKQLELFGIRLPENLMTQEIEDASSFWLSPASLMRLVQTYLNQSGNTDQEVLLGEKSLKTLRLSQEIRRDLLKDFQTLPRQKTSMHRDWENWLKGGNPHTRVTFDADTASQNPTAMFLMPLHPLVKQAANVLGIGKKVYTAVQVNTDIVPEGTYEFAIYQWQYQGIKEDLTFCPVAANENVTAHLIQLLERAQESDIQDVKDTSLWENLDTQHYTLWVDAQKKHQNQTQELANFRRESLTTSHQARRSLLQDQLEQATNEKIIKMRQAQIDAAEADFARRIQDLDIALQRSDITFSPVAYGILTVRKENGNAK